MMKFSSICDEFVKANGFTKMIAGSDDEAKRYASSMSLDDMLYPVIYTKSNTTGEKSFEEFYIHGEKINFDRFSSLGVVEKTDRRSIADINELFDKFETIFSDDNFTKSQVVSVIKDFLPNFEHEEKGLNLDSKM